MSQIYKPLPEGGGGIVNSITATAPLEANGVSGMPESGNVTLTYNGADLHAARFIVSAGGSADGANYTTISSAYAAAVSVGSPQTVFIQPGTYTENITLSPGINLSAFTCDSLTPNVTINGQLAASFNGKVTISGINLKTNSTYCLAVSGASPTFVYCVNCNFNITNNIGILYGNANSASQIFLQECTGNIGSTGIYLINMTSPGTYDEYECFFTNTGLSTSMDVFTQGTANFLQNYRQHSVHFTNTAAFGMNYSKFDTSAINQACVLHESNQGCGVNFCSFTNYNNSTPALTINGSAQMIASSMTINCLATNVITGTGTLEYTPISFIATGKGVTVSTQTVLPIGPKIGCTFANTNGTIYYDGTELNSVSPGTSGYVFTSNGGSSPPSFQNPSASTLMTTFTTPGTANWTPNSRTVEVEFYVWGAGGGGGSGRCGASGAASGGGGGGGGSFVYFKCQSSVLTASPYTVTVGSGGAGGLSINATTTNGNPGTQGGNSSIGSVVIATGGTGATAAGTGTSTGGNGNLFSIGYSNTNAFEGGNGQATTGIAAGNVVYGATTGGGGASGYATTTARAGAAGGSIVDYAANVLVAGGLAGDNTGDQAGAGNAPSGLSFLVGGTGGGGGGHDGTTVAGSGNNGGSPGGGGGGGAGNLSLNASGAGGTGGNGQVVIIEYF